jgi:hypothetical protein
MINPQISIFACGYSEEILVLVPKLQLGNALSPEALLRLAG